MAQFLGFAVVSADGTTLHAEGVSDVEHLGVDLYYSTLHLVLRSLKTII